MSSRILRGAVAGVALAGLATAGMGLGLGSAQAAQPAIADVAGTGTILPGLPSTGCTSGQVITFDGTAVVAGAPGDAGTYPLHFLGGSNICESLTAGKGAGNLTGAITGAVNYNRTGNAVQITAPSGVTVNGSTRSLTAAACVFVPVPGVTVTAYALNCHAVVQ